MPSVDADGIAGHYEWSVDQGSNVGLIFLRYDDPPAVTVDWAGDWATAERHLAAIGPGVVRRLLMLARPVSLVNFGVAAETAVGDTADSACAIKPAETLRARSRRQGSVSSMSSSVAGAYVPGLANGYP